jgi:hypothetical protein
MSPSAEPAYGPAPATCRLNYFLAVAKGYAE